MMLRFRKMMAVLLAAALTLTMLTACGGGGSGRASVDAKVKLTNDINNFLTGSDLKVEYDKTLDQVAETIQASYIKNKDDTNKILKESHKWMIKVEIDEETSDEAKWSLKRLKNIWFWQTRRTMIGASAITSFRKRIKIIM